MWLVYGSLIFVGIVITLFVVFLIRYIKNVGLAIKHLSELAEKVREQTEPIKKQQESLQKQTLQMRNSVEEGKALITVIKEEGKAMVPNAKRIFHAYQSLWQKRTTSKF